MKIETIEIPALGSKIKTRVMIGIPCSSFQNQNKDHDRNTLLE